MKIQLLLYTFLLGVLIGCTDSSPQTAEIRQRLLQKWSQDTALTDFLTKHPHAAILAIEYCQTHDCKALLLEADVNIPVYQREDAFMRGISSLIKIYEIELSTASPYISYELMESGHKENTRRTITLEQP